MKGKIQQVISKVGHNRFWHRLLTSYLITIILIEILLLFFYWPRGNQFVGKDMTKQPTISAPANEITNQQAATNKKEDFSIPEKQLLILVILTGALGASLHGATSLSEYIGNKTFSNQWVTWYLLRPFVGGVLVILFYFVMRAGFISNFNSATNFYAIIAISGLVGLFSKQALYKLSDVFDALFKSDQGNKLEGKLEQKNPVPDINKISPSEIDPAAQDKTITVTGCDFIKPSVVKLNGEDIPTKFIDETKLTASFNEVDLTGKTEINLTVFNPEPKGGESKKFLLNVKQNG